MSLRLIWHDSLFGSGMLGFPAVFPETVGLSPAAVSLLGDKCGKEWGGPMALSLNIGKCTLLGNYRENNEDSIDVKQFPDLTICLVADGMGGQAAGEIASKKAIDVVPRELKKHLQASITQEDQAKAIIRKSIVQA